MKRDQDAELLAGTEYHEAGHAAMAVRIGSTFQGVSIRRNEHDDGFVGLHSAQTWSPEGVLRFVYVALAGPVARAIHDGIPAKEAASLSTFRLMEYGGQQDLANIEDVASPLFAHDLPREVMKRYVDQLRLKVQLEVAAMLGEAGMWAAVEKVAVALLVRTELSVAEVEELAPHLLPPTAPPEVRLSPIAD